MATNALDQIWNGSAEKPVGSGLKTLYDGIMKALDGRERIVFPEYLPWLQFHGLKKVGEMVAKLLGPTDQTERAAKKKPEKIHYRIKRSENGTIVAESFPGVPSEEPRFQFEIDSNGRLLRGRVPFDLWEAFGKTK